MKNYILMTMLMISSVAINGMDVDRDPIAERKLILASEAGNLNAVKELLAKNADVNCKRYGTAPLGHAIINDDLEMCKLLIANNANIHLAVKKGQTPLMKAAEIKSREICELLVRKMLFADLFEELEEQKELKAKMVIFLGCCKRSGVQYNNMRNIMTQYRHPRLASHPELLELRRKNGRRVRKEINKISDAELKMLLLKKYCNQ